MRVAITFVLLVACGPGNPTTPTDCADGETRECYGGPPGTENVGPCKIGLESCSGGRWPGICIGDVVPLVEQCNDFDDDCDGVPDDVAGTGEGCTGTNGCSGVKDCDTAGRVRCFAPSKNECELCDGPDVADLGDDCIANGCIGALVCTSDGRAASCAAPTQNECGVCGGAAVTGLDVDCTSTDSCPGKMVCNSEGTTAVCNAPMYNECLACFPSVGTIGETCSGDRGCVGATACNVTGDGRVCTLDAPCGHVMISEIATGSSSSGTGGTPCVTDEFIELHNPTSRTISLADYTLWSRTASSGNFNRLVALPSDATIAPHGFYLVVSNRGSTNCPNPGTGGGYVAVFVAGGNTVMWNATYGEQLSSTEGGVWLTKANVIPTGLTDLNVVDVVGWDNNLNAGDGTVFEGTGPAPAPEPLNANGSIERKANASSTAASMAAGGADVTAGNGYDTDDNAANFVAQAVRVPQNASSTPEP